MRLKASLCCHGQPAVLTRRKECSLLVLRPTTSGDSSSVQCCACTAPVSLGSLCYLRIRQLMKEDTCVLCKSPMDRVMVCKAENIRCVPLSSRTNISCMFVCWISVTHDRAPPTALLCPFKGLFHVTTVPVASCGGVRKRRICLGGMYVANHVMSVW